MAKDVESQKRKHRRARRFCLYFGATLVVVTSVVALLIHFGFVSVRSLYNQWRDVNGPKLKLQLQFLNVHQDEMPKHPAPLFRRSLGQSDVISLNSLKYRVIAVQLCRDLSVDSPTSESYTSTSGCISVYDGPFGLIPVDSMAPNTALIDENFVDFTCPHELQRLSSNTSFGYSQMGDYSWAVVSMYHTCVVEASIPLNGGSTDTFYTHPLNATRIYNGETLSVSDVPLTSGPAETVALECLKSDVYVRLQKPFSVVEADVKSGTVVKNLTMAVDLDGLLRAGTSYSATAALRDRDLNGVEIGVPGIAPVVHATTEKVFRETYLISFPTGTRFSPNIKARLELYYVDGHQSEVVAATWTSDLQGAQDCVFPVLHKITSIHVEDDKYQFWNINNQTLLGSFQRYSDRQVTQQCEMLLLDSVEGAKQVTTYQFVSLNEVK